MGEEERRVEREEGREGEVNKVKERAYISEGVLGKPDDIKEEFLELLTGSLNCCRDLGIIHLQRGVGLREKVMIIIENEEGWKERLRAY